VLAKKLAGIPQGWISATTPHARSTIPGNFSQLRELNTGTSVLFPTPEGRMKLYIENIAPQGGLPQYFRDDLTAIANNRQLLAANPEALEQIRVAGPKVSGIGDISFEWVDGNDFDRMNAPRSGMHAGENRAVMRAVADAYREELVPRLIRDNPGQQILVTNHPISLRRGTLYQRSGGMSPIDPLGTQYSLIQPTGQIQPINIFGGGLPRSLADSEALERVRRANLLQNVPGQEAQINNLMNRARALGWGSEAAKRAHVNEKTGLTITDPRVARLLEQRQASGGEVWY
jgi:hypothetical protein